MKYKPLNESIHSEAVKELILQYKQYADYVHVVGFWVNENGESVYSLNFLPVGKSCFTGLNILTNDDIVTFITYNGEFNLSKINLRLNDGGDPMIKKVFEKLGKNIKDARFILNLYYEARDGKHNYIIVFNNNGLNKYIKAIKDKKADIEKGHSNIPSNPLTRSEQYKYDKHAHSSNVQEWLYPLKDNIILSFIFWVGKNKHGEIDTLMAQDPMGDNRFEGLQYLTDNDIIIHEVGKGYIEPKQVNLRTNGGEPHVISLFKQLGSQELNKARLLIMLQTKDSKIVSFLLNQDGFDKYMRAYKRNKK